LSQLVSEQGLQALTEAVRSKEPWAIFSDRILAVLYDCVSRGSSKSGGIGPSKQEPGPSTSATIAPAEDLEGDTLLAAFQKLYGLFIVSTMTEALLQETPEAASEILSQVSIPVSGTDSRAAAADGTAPLDIPSNLEPLNGLINDENGACDRICDVTELEDHVLLNNDDDNGVYEPLEIPLSPSVAVAGPGIASTVTGDFDTVSEPINVVISKLLYLSSKLSYYVVSSPVAWQDGVLLSSLETCLLALRQHPSFLELLPAAGAVCNVFHDRCLHSGNLVEFAACMEALVKGLSLSKSSPAAATAEKEKSSLAILLGLSTAASLSGRLPQGPSRRKLWTQSDDFWIQVAAGILEQKEAQWRQQKKNKGNNTTAADGTPPSFKLEEEDAQIIAVSALITEFYILDAPVVASIDKIQDVLLSTGLFRGLILAFINCGWILSSESLRRTLIICCASCTGLLTWARAVPGFSNAWEHPEFAIGGSLERYGAIQAAVFGLAHGDEALAQIFLRDSRGVSASKDSTLSAEDIPEIYDTLKLVSSVQKARDLAGRGRKGGGATASFLFGSATVAALEALSSSLRSLKVALDDAAGDDNTNTTHGESEEAEKLREEEKLALSSTEQAEKLAARRAKLLQPECLRMVKGLRAKPGSIGKSD